MGTDAKKSGNANGFVPGLVLGVIIGAVTAFVALELLDTKSIDVQPGSASIQVELRHRVCGRRQRHDQEAVALPRCHTRRMPTPDMPPG